MYMAPEMVKGNIYNEKVDVFSLGVMLYEALKGRLTVMRIAMGGDPDDVARYAQQVAAGHREPLHKKWPPELCSLIESAWHQVGLMLLLWVADEYTAEQSKAVLHFYAPLVDAIMCGCANIVEIVYDVGSMELIYNILV